MQRARWRASSRQTIRLWMVESSGLSGSIRPLPSRRMDPSVSSASLSAMAKRPMPSCATGSPRQILDETPFGSVDVDRGGDSKHALSAHQDGAGERARRQLLPPYHLQGQGHYLAALAIVH